MSLIGRIKAGTLIGVTGSLVTEDGEMPVSVALMHALGELDRLAQQHSGAVGVAEAAKVYFREFDHLIGDADYPERADLREALRAYEGR